MHLCLLIWVYIMKLEMFNTWITFWELKFLKCSSRPEVVAVLCTPHSMLHYSIHYYLTSHLTTSGQWTVGLATSSLGIPLLTNWSILYPILHNESIWMTYAFVFIPEHNTTKLLTIVNSNTCLIFSRKMFTAWHAVYVL